MRRRLLDGAYLTAVTPGDDDAAYDLICAADRRRQSRATWVGRAQDDPVPLTRP